MSDKPQTFNPFRVQGQFSAGKLFLALAVTLGTGVAAGLLSLNAKEVYSSLTLPSFAPPAQVFAPVWIALYILMGLALYRILMLPDKNERRLPLMYFGIQLAFNILWSLLFFTFGLRLAALADILILLFYVILTAVKFYSLDKAAGLMLLPYVLWVAFATLLNLAVVALNG